jgi:hypothetical protein
MPLPRCPQVRARVEGFLRAEMAFKGTFSVADIFPEINSP